MLNLDFVGFLPGVPCMSVFRGYFNNVLFQTIALFVFGFVWCVGGEMAAFRPVPSAFRA